VERKQRGRMRLLSAGRDQKSNYGMFALDLEGCNCLMARRRTCFEEDKYSHTLWMLSGWNDHWSNLNYQMEKGLMRKGSCRLVVLSTPRVLCHYVDTYGMNDDFQDPYAGDAETLQISSLQFL
jgi:hypothetical protein